MASKQPGKAPAPTKTAPKPVAHPKRTGLFTSTAPAAPQAAPAPKPGASTDWERIELDYRAGIKSLREIADGTGVSHVTVSKQAKKLGWVRDLSAKIQSKADDLVNKAAVNKPVNTASAVSERETVEANALAIADVRLAQRKDIQRARRITNALLDELELQTDPATLALLRELGEMMRNEDERGIDKRNDLYRAVLGLSERSKTMKTLSESLRTLIDMERTAFGMDKDTGKTVDALGSLLHEIAGGSGNGFKPVAIDPERPVLPAAGSSLGVSQHAGDDWD